MKSRQRWRGATFDERVTQEEEGAKNDMREESDRAGGSERKYAANKDENAEPKFAAREHARAAAAVAAAANAVEAMRAASATARRIDERVDERSAVCKQRDRGDEKRKRQRNLKLRKRSLSRTENCRNSPAQL